MLSDDISIQLLKNFHKEVVTGILADAGYLRTEESAIFTMAGIAVYLPPAPSQIIPLLSELCMYINTATDHPLVIAASSHFWFEKIHPFLDGNGRVGRLLSFWILQKKNFSLSEYVAIEEYFDLHRDEYYSALSKDSQDITHFIHFFINSFYKQATYVLEHKPKMSIPSDLEMLLPRRAEIVQIVRDHVTVSFDFLQRRFQKIPERTLHNDISQLIKKGYITRKGTTRGALYSAPVK
jgi:Fic family protein